MDEAPDDYWRSLKLAAPARRALVGAGLLTLKDLAKVTRASVADLHGMGPNALAVLDAQLDAAGLSYGRKSVSP